MLASKTERPIWPVGVSVSWHIVQDRVLGKKKKKKGLGPLVSKATLPSSGDTEYVYEAKDKWNLQ